MPNPDTDIDSFLIYVRILLKVQQWHFGLLKPGSGAILTCCNGLRSGLRSTTRLTRLDNRRLGRESSPLIS